MAQYRTCAEMSAEMDYGGSGSSGNGKLRQWLIEQVDCGKYPGLVWENDEKSIFRIPWKHAGKQDYNRDEDAALFKVTPPPPRVLFPGRTRDSGGASDARRDLPAAQRCPVLQASGAKWPSQVSYSQKFATPRSFPHVHSFPTLSL